MQKLVENIFPFEIVTVIMKHMLLETCLNNILMIMTVLTAPL